KEVAQIRDQDEKDLELAKQKAAVAHDKLAGLRAELRQMTHRVDVSPETLRGAITRLEDERDKLSLDVEAMGVRRKAVEATIAKISKSAVEQIRGDRIAVE